VLWPKVVWLRSTTGWVKVASCTSTTPWASSAKQLGAVVVAADDDPLRGARGLQVITGLERSALMGDGQAMGQLPPQRPGRDTVGLQAGGIQPRCGVALIEHVAPGGHAVRQLDRAHLDIAGAEAFEGFQRLQLQFERQEGLAHRQALAHPAKQGVGQDQRQRLLAPGHAGAGQQPGRPKQWSPWTWVMKIPRRSRTESGLCSNWCWVPSPQSTRYQPWPVDSMTAVALTLRALVGTPEEVPRNCRSIA
jgi:hypothetical protein